MTQAALTAAVNALLASGQPITAAMHRAAQLVVTQEMYNANSRGAVLANVDTVLTLSNGDKVFIIRDGEAKLIDGAAYLDVNGGTP
jgi:hypothetical protein